MDTPTSYRLKISHNILTSTVSYIVTAILVGSMVSNIMISATDVRLIPVGDSFQPLSTTSSATKYILVFASLLSLTMFVVRRLTSKSWIEELEGPQLPRVVINRVLIVIYMFSLVMSTFLIHSLFRFMNFIMYKSIETMAI